MIECIFTLDYEIYGDGQGSLQKLIYEPTEKLISLFMKSNARFVAFVEVAELEVIEAEGTDQAIGLVKDQIRKLKDIGFELGLHLHPQWCKARYHEGKWSLAYDEYNLSTLSPQRIHQIVDRSILYFRKVLSCPDFTPFSFRAGNWLLQPTKVIAAVLIDKGIKVDSSVFKGGMQRDNGLDYRPSLRNGYCWRFRDDVNSPDPEGDLLEIPTYTRMVPPWKMLTKKRIGLQSRNLVGTASEGNRVKHLLDYFRLQYPIKLDFCRMTIDELTWMIDAIIAEDQRFPFSYKPIVAIGHSKDLVNLDTVKAFLLHLQEKNINIATFYDVYSRCIMKQSNIC